MVVFILQWDVSIVQAWDRQSGRGIHTGTCLVKASLWCRTEGEWFQDNDDDPLCPMLNVSIQLWNQLFGVSWGCLDSLYQQLHSTLWLSRSSASSAEGCG